MHLTDQALYVDSSALEAYDSHDGQEFIVSEMVRGSPSEVFDAWLRDVWVAGGDQVQEGGGRGLVGYIRRVPLGIEEEILSVGLPEDPAARQDSSPRNPSICYRLRKFGPFPLQSHLALVRFVDSPGPQDGKPHEFLHLPLVFGKTMRRNSLDPARYTDAHGFEEFYRYRGQELVVSECVVGSPSEVFDAWLQQVWLQGGTELHGGAGRGFVGHVRRAALGVEEEVVSAGLPLSLERGDSDGGRPSRARHPHKIPSISYRSRSLGLVPMQSHFGFVQFVDLAASPESTPSTLVIWSLKMKPSVLGYLFCCGGFASLVMRISLLSALGTLAASAAAGAGRHLE